MDPTTSDNSNCPKGSIAERRAEKCGFNAESINTARFRTDKRVGPFASSPTVVRSPLLTIPPGISPTALLDSPILLPSSQPSPTTGFTDERGGHGRLKEGNASSSFADAFPEYSGFFNQGNDGDDLHALVSRGTIMDFEYPTEFQKGMAEDDSAAGAKLLESNDRCPKVSANRSDQQQQPACRGSKEALVVEEQKGVIPAADAGRSSEDDGFNWRKYGQKQVKDSEFPRSYYKCTHTNCQVKKKTECSHEGRITEIIYKGNHNHPKPQPNRHALPGTTSSLDGTPATEEVGETSVKPEGVSAWRSAESGCRDFRCGVSDRRFDGMEKTSSTSAVTELSDPQFEPAATLALSHLVDGAIQASPSVELDFNDEESESKRRRIDSCLVEANITSRAVRESRIMVQIESEVDILDDGYRWRKYGQKVVKGNPNPRSYYKCTSLGCSVRKHVERASHNLRFVITTYEGKHNHEVPAARNSTLASSRTSNGRTGMGYGGNTNGQKSDSQMQHFSSTFKRKPMFSNDYLRPAFPINFGNDPRLLGPSSMYLMKFPSIQSSVPCGPFGRNSNQSHMHHPVSIASFIPNFPYSMPSSIRAPRHISTGQVQQFLSGQHMMGPKQEQKENGCDAGSSITDQAHVSSGSSSSSLYQRIMRNFSS